MPPIQREAPPLVDICKQESMCSMDLEVMDEHVAPKAVSSKDKGQMGLIKRAAVQSCA